MHKPPSELNENLYWLGLSPADLVSIMVVTLGLYYFLGVFDLELASFFLAIGYAGILHFMRRTRRKKYIRDFLSNLVHKEGKIEHFDK